MTVTHSVWLAGLQVPMPENPPWWEAFQVSQQQVHSVVATLLELYSRPRAEVRPPLLHTFTTCASCQKQFLCRPLVCGI